MAANGSQKAHTVTRNTQTRFHISYAYCRTAWNLPIFWSECVFNTVLNAVCVGIWKMCCRMRWCFAAGGVWMKKEFMEFERHGHWMHFVWKQWKVMHNLVYIRRRFRWPCARVTSERKGILHPDFFFFYVVILCCFVTYTPTNAAHCILYLSRV